MARPGLLFCHGMWSTPATFGRLRAGLEAAGWVTAAPALPWHDRDVRLPPPPDLGRLGLRDYADFLVAEAGKLGPHPVIIGHSMGSLLAQQVAARVPHAGLVLLSPAASASAQVLSLAPARALWPLLRHWGWWERPTLCPAAAARWGIFNGVPDAIADAEIAALVWDSGRVLAQMAAPWATGQAAQVDYARLVSPTLVMSGLEDRITPTAVARATARQIRGAVDYHELPGVGHWLFWGQVETQVAEVLARWLDRLA
jgi:pimeloyl-ACP methyl ester carboxylesterase